MHHMHARNYDWNEYSKMNVVPLECFFFFIYTFYSHPDSSAIFGGIHYYCEVNVFKSPKDSTLEGPKERETPWWFDY